MFSARFISIALIATCGLFSAPAASSAADAMAAGKVTLNGKPLAAGKVIFYIGNDQFVGSKIKDGKYSVDHLPAGTHRVVIEGEGVPANYASEKTSPLMVQVKDGVVALDFELK